MDSKNIAELFTGISAVGSGMSAYGTYEKGRVEKAGYEYNAEVALKKMQEEEETSRLQFRHLMGQQKTLYGKAGVDITSGSPLLIMADTAAQAEEEQQRIRESGTSEAEIQRYYGRAATYGGRMGAMTTFLTGLGKAGLQYAKIQKGEY